MSFCFFTALTALVLTKTGINSKYINSYKSELVSVLPIPGAIKTVLGTTTASFEDSNVSIAQQSNESSKVLAAAIDRTQPLFDVNIQSSFKEVAEFVKGLNSLDVSTGTLEATGAANLSSTLNVTGNTTVSTLNGTGLATFGNNVGIAGDLTSPSTTFNLLNTGVTTLNIGGAATTTSISATTGTTTVNNNLTVKGALNSSGKITGSGDLSISGATALSGALDVTGNSTFANITKINGVTYSFPTSQGAASSSLVNDGAGTLTWSTSSSGITGSGTANSIPKFTGASAIGNSLLTDNGTSLSYNSAFTVNSTGAISGATGFSLNLGSDATGDIFYRNSGGSFARLGIGTSGQSLTVTAGLPSWTGGSGTGSSGFWTRTSTTLSPFNAGDNIATTGNIGIGSTSAPTHQLDVNATTTTGTIFNLAYGSLTALTGDLTGSLIDLDTGNVTATNQNLTGIDVKLPTVTNTNTTGTKTLTGFLVDFGTGSGINQNGSGGTTTYNALSATLPALTQTAGTLNVNGLNLTTPSSITTGGTATGVNISASGVGAGTLNGVNISAITGSTGTETALNIGSGWDNVLSVNGTSVINGSGVTQVAGGGTSFSTYTKGDILYSDATNSLAKLPIGTTNFVLTVSAGGVPSWNTISGSSCTNCLINNPTSDQVVAPTGDTTGMAVRQTTTGSPTHDIFSVANSTGVTKYLYVDSNGVVNIPSIGSSASDQLTITPGTDKFALKLVGTNVATNSLQIINPGNTSGTIFNTAYTSAKSLAGSLTGFNLDLNTNLTVTNQSLTAQSITLPTFTNTNTTGTNAYYGLLIAPPGGGGINQNGAGGTSTYNLVDLTMPALTQTAGTLTSTGLNLTTPSAITTGGTATGINLTASGVGAGTLTGINISNITGGAGTETGIAVGTGWDTAASFGGKISVTDSAVTTGNVITATASAITSGNILDLGQGGNTNFTGNAILADMDNTGQGGIGFTGNFLQFKNAGTAEFQLTSAGNLQSIAGAKWQPLSDSTTALNIANATGTSFVTFDTTNKKVSVTSNSTTNVLSVAGTGAASNTLSVTNNSLTIGRAFLATGTSTATTNTAIQQDLFDIHNSQSTLANTNYTGLAVNYTQTTSIAGNTEFAARIQNQSELLGSTDTNVSGLLLLDNADAVSGSSITVTDALRITNSGGIAAGITNGINLASTTIDTGINFSATPTTNYILGTNFSVDSAGKTGIGRAAGSGSFLSLAAGTTALSQINFASSTDKSSPVSGDLWWNGTNLDFRSASATKDLLAGVTSSGTSLANQIAYFTTDTNITGSTSLLFNPANTTGTGTGSNFYLSSTGTTTGDIISATSSAITSGNFIKLGEGGNQGFSGNGIFMDFDNQGGGGTAFTGNFLKLDTNSTDKFVVSSAGTVSAAGVYQGTSGTNTRLEATGTTTGSGNNSSIYFLDSTGNTKARVETNINQFGNGADGAITVSTSKNINTTSIESGRPTCLAATTCADGIAYRVISPAIGSNTVTRFSGSDTISNGIAANDEVLLINMQGTTSDNAQTGNYEFLRVSSVTSSTITFSTAITKEYRGSTLASQMTIIQRVPNYTSVTVSSGGTITASAWDGLATTPAAGAGYLTGIVVFRANGTVSVQSGGTISVSGLGFRGGAGGAATGSQPGSVAETYNGNAGGGTGSAAVLSSQVAGSVGGGGGGGSSQAANGAAGGGGGSYGAGGGGGGGNAGGSNGGAAGAAETSGGGGGGYGGGTGGTGGAAGTGGTQPGAAGSGTTGAQSGGTQGSTGGAGGGGGGGKYGTPNLATMYFGSGGGGGGSSGTSSDAQGGAGGIGGGIVYVGASTITVAGTIVANGGNGTAGSTNAINRGGGGGGSGSGGSVYILSGTTTLGTSLVSAIGGTAGAGGGSSTFQGGQGGTGGGGRIFVASVNSISGTTNPSATTITAPNYGTLFIGSVNTTSADLAEYYMTNDPTVEPGDVVSLVPLDVVDNDGKVLNTKGVLGKADTPYDGRLVGIISTSPGITLGSIDGKTGAADERQLALTGRVPVKIDPDSDPIMVGDFLTSSSKAGYAKKATKAGYVVAKALESWDKNNGKDRIDAFIHLGYYMGDMTADGFVNTNQSFVANDIKVNVDLATYNKLFPTLPTINTATDSGTATSSSTIYSSPEATGSSNISLSQTIASLVDRLQKLEADDVVLKNQILLGGTSTSTATDSSQLNNLTVLGKSILGDTIINGKLNVGGLTVDSISQSVNAIGVLKIQDLALGNVEFMNGLVTIDTNGSMTVKSITSDKYKVAGTSAGSDKIVAGQTSIIISSTQVTDKSLIFVTAKDSTSLPLAVTSKTTGTGFKVEIPNSTNKDINFDWWIVDKQ